MPSLFMSCALRHGCQAQSATPRSNPSPYVARVYDPGYNGLMDFIFEWDDRKALSNAAKHGVTFAEAATTFADPLSVTVPDARHDGGEVRFAVFGQSGFGRLLVVMYTERWSAIRIISARPVTPRE